MSNQTRLFVLVFLAFLPTVGLYWYANRSLRAADRENQEAQLLHLANRAGLEYRRILDHSESLLGALSEIEVFRDPRQPECNLTLAAIMEHMNDYTTIQVIEADGFVSCGALPIDGSLFVGDRYYHQASIANRRFTVGNFLVGRLTGKPIVGLAHPVRASNGMEVNRIVVAYLDLNQLANSVYEMDIPTGATFTVLDRGGTVMVRVPEGRRGTAPDTVGAQVPETFPSPTGAITGPYLLTGTDLDGVERTFAVEPLRAAGRQAYGHVLIGVDEATMREATDFVALRQLQILALAGLFLIGLAWAFGQLTLLRDEPQLP